MDGDALESMVLDNLTDGFLQGAIRTIFQARRKAYDICLDTFEPPEAKNLRPLMVRGKINEYLRGVAEVVPNCEARVERSAGSSILRTELWGGPVCVTVHTVQHPCGKVKKYKYRRSLAQGNQGTLFDAWDGEEAQTLYAVILHGPLAGRTPKERLNFEYLPGSIYLAFPTSELRDYSHVVNLVERYPALIDSLLPSEWDDEARVFYRYQSAARDIG